MADRKDDGGVVGFINRTEGLIIKLIGLVTGIGGLLALLHIDVIVGGVVAATVVPVLILLFVCLKKVPATHDPRKKHYKYDRRNRRAAWAGVVILPMAAGLLVWRHLVIPPIPCPPVTVTITRFLGDSDVARRIQTHLDTSLRKKAIQGMEIKSNPQDFVVSGLGEIGVKEAKEYANSREGHGHIIIWGDVTSRAAFGTIANKCDRTGPSVLPQTPTNARTDAFEFEFDASGDVEDHMIDFAQFVIGLVLYERRQWQEAADVLTDVRSPFGALYEGLARQEFARSSDEMERAIQAYERCVGSWKHPDAALNNQSKALAVAAYINASNVLLDLSDLEPEKAEAHLQSAFTGYTEAINRYDQLKTEAIERYGRPKLDPIVGSDWLTIARTNLAITKVRLAAGYQQQRPEWLHDAEQDFNNILDQLDQNKDSDRESWAIAEANLGSLCLELSRVEPERTKRLGEAEDHLGKALVVLDSIHKCSAVGQDQGLYDCAVLKSNLGTVFLERALDEPSRDEALKCLRKAEAHYGEAIRLFSADPSRSVESAEETSKQGLVLIARARWFENGERERLLRKALQNSTEALTFYRSDLYPSEWASITNDLAYAERELGNTLGDNELLMSSIEHCNKSLTIGSYEQVYRRTYWAAAQRNLGDSLYALGVATGNRQQVSDAINAYEAALRVWTDHDAHYDWAKTTDALNQARTWLQ